MRCAVRRTVGAPLLWSTGAAAARCALQQRRAVGGAGTTGATAFSPSPALPTDPHDGLLGAAAGGGVPRGGLPAAASAPSPAADWDAAEMLAFWDGYASGYDTSYYGHWSSALHAHLEGVLAAQLGGLEGKRILDAGCGTGALAVRLASRGACVTAVDCSSGMVQAAGSRVAGVAGVAQRQPDIRLVEARLEEAGRGGGGVVGGPFDAVVCHDVLPYVSVPGEVLSAVRAAVKPGGVAVVSTFSHVDRCPALAAVYRLASARCSPSLAGCFASTTEEYEHTGEQWQQECNPVHLYGRAERLRLAMESAGWADVALSSERCATALSDSELWELVLHSYSFADDEGVESCTTETAALYTQALQQLTQGPQRLKPRRLPPWCVFNVAVARCASS